MVKRACQAGEGHDLTALVNKQSLCPPKLEHVAFVISIVLQDGSFSHRTVCIYFVSLLFKYVSLTLCRSSLVDECKGLYTLSI